MKLDRNLVIKVLPNLVPRCDTSIVSSTMARPATDRAPIDVHRAFFSKFLAGSQ